MYKSLIILKYQADDDTMGSTHVAECIITLLSCVAMVCLFTSYSYTVVLAVFVVIVNSRYYTNIFR